MTASAPLETTLVKIDYAALALKLRTLGHENRLRLVALLRQPRPIGDLLLPPGPGRSGDRPERPIRRQSVLDHLHLLQEIGLVRAQKGSKARSAQFEYVTVRAQLFALMENLREVLQAQSTSSAGPLETVAALPWSRQPTAPQGPRLVLVQGADPGRAFPLRQTDLASGRGWIIGRKESCHVSLDYDPYASSETAEVIRDATGYRIIDLRTARNGTWLNWARLPLGETAPLRTGDVIGVGRSLLLFRLD